MSQPPSASASGGGGDGDGNGDGDTTMPSICFEACDNAYKIGLETGKSDTICDAGGEFQVARRNCEDCVVENSPESEGGDNSVIQEYIDPRFVQFLEYCGIDFVTTTVTHLLRDGGRATATLVMEMRSDTITTLESSTTTETTQTTGSSSTTGSASNPIETRVGGGTNYRDSAISIHSPVIGLIVGGVAALLILLGLAFWFWRRRQRKARAAAAAAAAAAGDISASSPDQYLDKAQLHGDSMKVPELYRAELHPDTIHEMDGSTVHEVSSIPSHSEKPANEIPAHEKTG